jgi:molybdopterin molybdotransferase
MSPPLTALQRIIRLAPLSEVHAAVDGLATPVKLRWIDVGDAVGRVLASDTSVEAALPAKPMAFRDGWAVSSDVVADAGPYAPVPLNEVAWVENGQLLPAGTDAVLPLDAVTAAGSTYEAIAPASPGEGVIAAGADATPGQPLRRMGEMLRGVDIGALRAAGVTRVEVRSPRVDIISTSPEISAATDSVAPLIARALEAIGATAHIVRSVRDGSALEHLLASDSADAVITIGGTGVGHRDRTVEVVAQIGSVAIHGMGIRPGETAALGQVGVRPVLMLPGRIDAALAGWLLVGRRIVHGLTGAIERELTRAGTLTRKITSTIGIADIVLVRRGEHGLEPLATQHVALQAMTRADGWVLVPPESEGYPARTIVDVRALP